ncbi:hypothetical protein ACXYMO_06395 [Arenibacterium sp. CAU 1754]
MKIKAISLLALGLCLAACEKEKGVGFTGIGQESTQSSHSGYALDFKGLAPAAPTSASKPSGKATR